MCPVFKEKLGGQSGQSEGTYEGQRRSGCVRGKDEVLQGLADSSKNVQFWNEYQNYEVWLRLGISSLQCVADTLTQKRLEEGD